jgi:hypothetical protein
MKINGTSARRGVTVPALVLLLLYGTAGGATAAGIAGVPGTATAIRRTTAIPVLLPRALPDSVVGGGGLLLTVVTANATSYEAAITTGHGCTRPACRLGFVRGERATAGRVPGDLVRLGNGRTGYFERATCTSGCTMSTLAWQNGTYRYELGLRGASLTELRSSAASIERY